MGHLPVGITVGRFFMITKESVLTVSNVGTTVGRFFVITKESVLTVSNVGITVGGFFMITKESVLTVSNVGITVGGFFMITKESVLTISNAGSYCGRILYNYKGISSLNSAEKEIHFISFSIKICLLPCTVIISCCLFICRY